MLFVQPSMAEHHKPKEKTQKDKAKHTEDTNAFEKAGLAAELLQHFSLTRSSRFSTSRKESLSKERIGGMPCAHPSRGNVAAGGIPVSHGLPAKSVHFSTTLPVVQRSGAWQNQFEFSHATRASGKFYRAGCSSAHEGHQESELRVFKK